MSKANDDRIEVTYWSDPLCIWAFVSHHRHEAIRDGYIDRVSIVERVVPVFGSVPRRFRDGSWSASGPAGRAEKTREIAASFGIEDVDGALWVDDPPASSWSPGMAVVAVRAMVRDGDGADPGQDSLYHLALRNAAFRENRNTARREVQLEVAESLGLSRAAMERRLDDGTAMAALWEDHRAREAHKVQGSPTYVCDGGREMLYGNVAEAVVRATFDALLDGRKSGGSAC